MHQAQSKWLTFDNYTFRCSQLGLLMSEPRGMSPIDAYNNAVIERDTTVQKLLEKLNKAKLELSELDNNPKTNKETKKYIEASEKPSRYQIEYDSKKNELDTKVQELYLQKDNVILSETTKKYLIKCYLQAMYGIEDEIESRYTDKGNKVEQKAISVLSDIDDKFYKKNLERVYDKHKEGECDIRVPNEEIIDTKCCWDIFTFEEKRLLFLSERNIASVNKMNFWQGQGYMDLYGEKRCTIAYVLIDTPEGLVEDVKKRLLYKMGSNHAGSKEYEMGCQEIERNSYYPYLKNNQRVVRFVFHKDEEAISRLHERIEQCRKWLNWYSEMVYYMDNPSERPQEENLELEDSNFQNKLDDSFEKFKKQAEEEGKSVADVVVQTLANMISEDTELQALKLQKSISEELPIQSKTIEVEIGFDKPKIIQGSDNLSQDVAFSGTIPQPESVKVEMNINISKEGNIVESGVLKIEEEEVKPEDVVNSFVEQSEEEKQLIRIGLCSTEDECITLYQEIMKLFSTYPNLKTALVDKRNSLKPPAPVEAPKPEPKEKVEPMVILPSSSANNKPTKDDLRAMADKCKSVSDVVSLYNSNKDFINLDSNKDLRSYIESVGKRLDLESKKVKIDTNNL